MWDTKGGLIQLELGSKVRKAFSSNRKEECDLLIKQIVQLRSQLEANGIALPVVQIRDSPVLPQDEYMLYMGILFVPGNYKQQSPVSLIGFWAQQFHIESYAYDQVQSIFNKGVQYFISKEIRDYNKATIEFVKAYYCASMGVDTYSIMVNSTINICSIQLQNGNLDFALLDAQRAVNASFMDGFQDPHIKYHSLMWLAVVYIKKNDPVNALEHFMNAYHAIKETGENQLKIISLWATAYLAAQQGNIPLSTNALDIIVDILDTDQQLNFDKDFYILLIKFRNQVSRIQIAALELELDKLKQEYNKISRKFLYRVGEAVLSIVQEVGPILISTYVGSLSSAIYNFSKGDIIYGKEVNLYQEGSKDGKNQ